MIDKMIGIVAKGFAETMKEENFDSFQEMSECYWWTTGDIKEEVTWYINNMCSEYGYIFDDGSEIMTWNETENMTYRSFIAKVRKLANKMVQEGCLA